MLGLALATAEPSRPQEDSPGRKRLARRALEPYLAVVSRYRSGDVDGAVAAIRDWSERQIGSARDNLTISQGLLRLKREHPDEIELRVVEAAVLLHTDASLEAWETRAPQAQRHLHAAGSLLNWLDAAEKDPSVVAERNQAGARGESFRVIVPRDWYLATTLTLHGFWQLEEADRLAMTAVRRFPADPELLLAAGSIKEARALLSEWQMRPRPLRLDARRLGRMQVDRERLEAERLYRRVLDLDPARHEARLRLGRVLAQSGRAPDAVPELRAVLEGAGEARLSYMTRLFLGRIHEDSGRLEEAIAHYRGAVELCPDAQAGRVALAHALERSGDPSPATRLLLPLLEQVERRPVTDDPWWVYPLGRYERGVQLLRALRDDVTAP